ncbi:MAG: OmpA family protein, partial [Flavobacteriales bacterium]|nr:OmpA family protein [Flavobacteriales bacterium]
LEESDKVTAVAMAPCGKYSATGTADGHVTIWNMPNGTKDKTLQGHRGRVTSAEFTPDCRYLLTSSADSTVRLWDLSTGLVKHSYLGHTDRVNDISFGPDGNYFVSVSDDGNALMWETGSEQLVGVYDEHKGAVRTVDYAPLRNFVVTGGKDKTVTVWDGSTAKRITDFKLHGAPVTQVKVSPDASMAVSGSEDGFLYSWKTADAGVRHAMVGLRGEVTGIYISKDSEYVVASDKGNSPKVWKLNSGNEVVTLSGHTSRVNDVCFSPHLKFPEQEQMSPRQAELKTAVALEEEVERLERELAEIEKQRSMGYDPTLLDADVNRVKQLKAGQKIILERIYFDFDKADIRDESVVELNKLLVFLNANPRVVVEISGHTDSRGADDYNLRLSDRRAKSVGAWLKDREIPSKRMVAKGYGETRHIAPNENPDGTDNPDGRQMNRRIELTIISVGGDKIITTEGK